MGAKSSLLKVTGLVTEFGGSRGTVRAVDGVSFDIRNGECFAIVGESGSGKSATALSLMGLLPKGRGRVAAGRAELDGVDLFGLGPKAFRAMRGKDIAMIFQEPMTSLNPVFTVGDQVAEAINLHQNVGAAAARRRAVEMFDLVGIPDPEGRSRNYPHQMSGGMRQRVMIAMALSCNPRLLIADEPTTALDVTIQAQILELLDDLRRRIGTAVILITHDLGVVAEVADRVAVMYAGKIVETGDVEAVFEQPKHPYTEGLLGSIPRLDEKVDRLPQIRGSVPAPSAWPSGCRFRNRCDHARDICAGLQPPSVWAGTHGSACWRNSGYRAAAGEEARQ